MIKAQRHHDVELYKEHVIEQGLKILRAHDNIHCLFTTPKLLEALAQKIDLEKAGIKGVFCGGTEMNRQFNRFAREELIPGIDFVPTYGNTLMGLARPKPFDPADDYRITYYPPHPRAVFEIVNPENLDEVVPYGERGRVLLTTLTREFFMPRFAERDEGLRAEPCDAYPWDGVSDLGLLTELQTSVVVGVY
jgi:phenylacetate-coenzyme A ligase PaaK-like adenylate-forming protein